MSPWAAKPICGSCRQEPATHRGKCATCSRQSEQRRGTRQGRGYTNRWLRYSEAWRRRHPVCGERLDGELSAEHSACVREGRIGPAQVTDHIVPHRGDAGRFWDPANHQSLCASCHGAKSEQERG